MKVKNRSPRGAVPGGLFGGRRCLANARQLGQRREPLRVERGLGFALLDTVKQLCAAGVPVVVEGEVADQIAQRLQVALLGGLQYFVVALEQGLLARKAHELVAVGVWLCGHAVSALVAASVFAVMR